MGFNDEQEKLRQAGEWLKLSPDSEQFKAAWEHVDAVLFGALADVALYVQAQRLLDEVLERFGYEANPTDEEVAAAKAVIARRAHYNAYGRPSPLDSPEKLAEARPPSPWRPWEYPEYR
jgi:hypothetical protein